MVNFANVLHWAVLRCKESDRMENGYHVIFEQNCYRKVRCVGFNDDLSVMIDALRDRGRNAYFDKGLS